MCTAITLTTRDHYFGRNLDLEYSYHETVTVTPRNYPFAFRRAAAMPQHFAMIGMAFVVEGYPLYYDAVNEHGLAMAGLNFPGNAVYYDAVEGRDNISPFELIPWVLGQCKTIAEVRALLERTNVWREPFSAQLPLSPLHWSIADREHAIVLETMDNGMHIYDDPYGVLTNNPPFPYMCHNIATYRNLSPYERESSFADGLDLPKFCGGMSAVGLPGDLSSPSRFVRAAFHRANSVCADDEAASVGQFFHLLGSVEMPRGSLRLSEGVNDITVYSSCCNQDRGVYYYTTYSNRRITAVDMHREDLDGCEVVSYPLKTTQDISRGN